MGGTINWGIFKHGTSGENYSGINTSEPMFRAVRQDGAVTERLSALSVADIVKNERLSNAQDMWLLGHHFDGRQRYV